MTDAPGDHPFPHPELPSQSPRIFDLSAGSVLFRQHQIVHDPIFFGMTGNYRFDDPDCPVDATFGVLYAAEDPHCSFIESSGPTTGVPAVSGAFLDARAIARLEVTEDLRFIDLASSGGLTRIGADARLVTGSYRVAQRWSAALRLHPAKPDGIRYSSRHDPTRVAYAIFSRPRSTFSVSTMGSLMARGNRPLLNRILHDYRVDLL
jgi:hypothetical protein